MAFFGCVSDAFSNFKIKHIAFGQRRVHFGDIESDGQAGTVVGVKGAFQIITITSVIFCYKNSTYQSLVFQEYLSLFCEHRPLFSLHKGAYFLFQH